MRALLCTLMLTATAAQADLTVSFRDGAPKDRFDIVYDGACPLEGGRLTIDIGTAPAGLIFDTTATGAGVQVYQPFELVAGGENLTATPRIIDGDTAITLDLAALTPGSAIRFTIDVDDTTSSRQITVDGSEMSGATLRLDTGSAIFDATGSATLTTATCLS